MRLFAKNQVPACWEVFCTDFLQMSTSQAARWWEALARAKWSRSTLLRSTVLGIGAIAERPEQIARFWLGEQMSPGGLIACVEDLVREGCLPRSLAVIVEDAILLKARDPQTWLESG